MRHSVVNNKFRMKTAHRKATFSNMAKSLIEHGRIETTLEKAKYLRTYVEPLITLGKRGTLASRRVAIARLHHKDTVNRLFDVIAHSFKDRNGGYTRIIRSGKRRGDNANMAYIEFTDPIIEIPKPSKKDVSNNVVETAPTKATDKVVKKAPEAVAPDVVETVATKEPETVVTDNPTKDS